MHYIEAYDNKNKPIVDIQGCYAIKGQVLNGIDIFDIIKNKL